MAGEPNHPSRPPGVRPPPLLFQFPTLSPQPLWSIRPQQQHWPAPPQSSELEQMQPPFLPPPPPPQQQQQRFGGGIPAPPQLHRGEFGGNLNSCSSPPPAPDLNSPALPSHLGYSFPRHDHPKSQQVVFLERAGALVDQTTFLNENSSPAFMASPPRQQQQQQQDLPRSQLSSKDEARHAKRFRRMEMPVSETQRPVLQGKRVYPAPLAAHRDVVADEKVFLSTLAKFYDVVCGTQLRLPRFNDRDFEIHRLYCEVTEQGGMLKVTREKKWKDIASAFDLPRKVTNPVFFLRKNYEKFLHHYEQVYFHGKDGEYVPPPGELPAPVPVTHKIKDHDSEITESKTRSKSSQQSANPASSLGHTVTGAIEGKFEHGYFVTVMVGSEKLRGVIYSVPDSLAEEQQQFADVKSNSLESPHLLDPPGGRSGGKVALSKRKKRKRRVDGIKSVRNAYNFFVAEQRQKLRGGRDEMSKIIGDLWSNLPEKEKEPYKEMSRRDRERFNKELEEKKQRELRAFEDSEVEDDDDDDDEDDDKHRPVDGHGNKNLDAHQAKNDTGEQHQVLEEHTEMQRCHQSLEVALNKQCVQEL